MTTNSDFIDLILSSNLDEKMMQWSIWYIDIALERIIEDVDLANSMDGKSIINVGGGPFIFEWLIKRKGNFHQITSIDKHPERFSLLPEKIGIDIIKVDIEQDLSLDRTFDVVVFNQIFEHCRLDLYKTMRNLISLMSKDGVLIVSAPNGLSLQSIKKFIAGRTGPSLVVEWQKLYSLGHMGHVREYSKKELSEFFESCGFSIKQFSYQHSEKNYKMSFKRKMMLQFERAIPKMFAGYLVFILKSSQQSRRHIFEWMDSHFKGRADDEFFTANTAQRMQPR